MAQDNIGRLKHQIANLNSRLESEVGQAEARVRKLNAESIANNKLRNDMENRLHSKMEEVEAATKQNTGFSWTDKICRKNCPGRKGKCSRTTVPRSTTN